MLAAEESRSSLDFRLDSRQQELGRLCRWRITSSSPVRSTGPSQEIKLYIAVKTTYAVVLTPSFHLP